MQFYLCIFPSSFVFLFLLFLLSSFVDLFLDLFSSIIDHPWFTCLFVHFVNELYGTCVIGTFPFLLRELDELLDPLMFCPLENAGKPRIQKSFILASNYFCGWCLFRMWVSCVAIIIMVSKRSQKGNDLISFCTQQSTTTPVLNYRQFILDILDLV